MDPFNKRINDARQKDAGEVWEKIRIYLLQKGLIPDESKGGDLFWEKRVWHKSNAKSSKYSVSIRAYFIVKVFEIISRESFKELPFDHDIYKLVTIGEYCITIMYLENHFIDGKYGVTDRVSIKKNRLEKKQMLEKLYDFIEKEIDKSNKPTVLKFIYDLFDIYEKGNVLDQYKMGVDHFFDLDRKLIRRDEINGPSEIVDVSEIVDIMNDHWNKKRLGEDILSKSFFLKLYLSRSYMINGVFFELFAKLIIKLHSVNINLEKNIIDFARKFGVVQQLVNDNIDVLPLSLNVRTSSKAEIDVFSDLKRGMVTLPIFCHKISLENDVDRDIINRVLLDRGERKTLVNQKVQFEVLRELKHQKSISHAMSLVAAVSRDYYQNTDYSFLGNDLPVRNMALLRDLLGLAYSNVGYYNILNKV